jgi:hypothetical protein
MRRTAIFAAAAAALAATTCLAPGARAIQPQNCTAATLSGPTGTIYSVRLSGFIGRLPLAGAGTLLFNIAGGASGVFTFSKDFHVFQNITLSGPYTVNPDCTGTLSFAANLGNGQQHYVIGVNSTGFVGMQTDFGTSVTLDARQ